MRLRVLCLIALAIVFGALVSCSQPTPVPAAPAPTQAPTIRPAPTTPAVTRLPASPSPATPAPKQEPVSGTPYFEGKTVEMLAGTAAGGGTDATARAVAAYIPKYIPGNPRILVRNQGGAGGVVAANSFFERAKPDGLSWLHGSSSIIANQQRKREIVKFDMKKLVAIGNIGEAGPVVGIRKDAVKRLTDPKAEPVVVGTRTGEETWNLVPLYGKEFLGWNVRWLTGFGGTGEIVLAFRRGEIDMFGDSNNLKMLADEALADYTAQIGRYQNGNFDRRVDFPDVPTMLEVLGARKPTGIAWDGYISTLAPQAVFKFTGLPPGTPDNIAGILREAYGKMAKDPKFNDLLKKTFAEVYDINIGADTQRLVKDSLDVNPEAPNYVDNLLRKYGVMK